MMNKYIDPELEKLRRLAINEQENIIDQYGDQLSVKTPFPEFFLKTVTDERLKTLAMEYNDLIRSLKVQVIKDNIQTTQKQVVEYSMTEEAYLKFCRDTLRLDTSRLYNDSSSCDFNGVKTRVFAIMPPYKKYPLIVISTAKQPPTEIPTLSDVDEAKLRKVLNGNFLIAGKSGAGKTYLLNYLLSKYYPKDKRVGIIQEFMEIYPPNDFSECLTTPPRVPGQKWNDLEFLTEQSNLMRYDTILVGEIKSSEAWPFVVNCSSGTRGGATIHGSDCQGALQRLRTLCLMSQGNLNDAVVDKFIKDAIDYVVYVEDAQVKDIKKVTTYNRGTFSLEPVEVGGMVQERPNFYGNNRRV